jgi:hypothetical protein
LRGLRGQRCGERNDRDGSEPGWREALHVANRTRCGNGSNPPQRHGDAISLSRTACLWPGAVVWLIPRTLSAGT